MGFLECADDGQHLPVAALHEAASRTGKAKGSLSLEIAFELRDGVIEVVADFKAKAPKLARGRSIFWATPDNNLTKRNPRQPDLPFRDVSVPRAASGLA